VTSIFASAPPPAGVPRTNVGGIFVSGLGMLALGVPLMIACALRFKALFRGETLNAETSILVPDTGEPPRGGL
jgi:hypothetical protein